MAEIVLGIWTTHGPQLSTTPEQWMLRVPADRKRRHWFKGKEYSFEELVELRRSENLAEKSSLEARTRPPLMDWLALDEKARVGRMVRVPTRSDIPLPVQEQLIVELYSK